MPHQCSQGRRLLGLALVGLGLTAAPAHGALPAGADVERSATTGKVRFAGGSLGRPAGFTAASDPAAVGRAFLERSASDFGLGRASSLRVTRTQRRGRRSVIRYQQVLNGVPVLGGEFIVRLDESNAVQSTSGEATPAASVDAWPSLTTSEAGSKASAYVAKKDGVPAATLRVGVGELVVFDSAVVGGPGRPGPRLVWSIVVDDGALVRERVFVDAHLGAIVASVDETPEALTRAVCDNNSNTSLSSTCTAPVRSESSGATGIADVDNAFDFSGAAYTYFQSRFGRDSFDGAGTQLKTTVRHCVATTPPEDGCPLRNAFWTGEQMVYGEGYAVDDVVAHELAHGVTQHTSGLVYLFQSGAINESLSDIFGELMDQAHTYPGEPAGNRWLIGESLPNGALRNMSNPSVDSVQDPNYYAGEEDNGGVHINSGIGNKAAFLLVDGGQHNGRTVTAIGAEKVEQLFYEVETAWLTSGSDYNDLGTALTEACRAMTGGLSGMTAANCAEVADAVAATQMHTQRADPLAGDMPECPANGAADYVFTDDVEPAGGQAFAAPGPFGSGHFHWYAEYPLSTYTRDDWATSGETNWWGFNEDIADTYSTEQTAAVAIPAGGFLRFQHAHRFERTNGVTYDGGIVEASVNGGAWQDAVPSGTYNGTVANTPSNDLRGRRAFVGNSHGYRATVVPLGGLVPPGQSARFRFRIGTDSAVGADGWYVDDIAIGTCSAYAVGPASAANEGAGGDQLVITRTGGLTTRTVRVTTTAEGVARPGVDFQPLSTDVDIAPNATVTVPLTVINDSADESDETVGVALAFTDVPTKSFATGTVLLRDDDLPAPPPPPPPGNTVGTGPGGIGTTGTGTGTEAGTSVGGSATSTSGGPPTVGGGGIGAAPVTLLSVRPGARRVTFRMRLSRPGTVTVLGRLKGKRIRGVRRAAPAGPLTVSATLPRSVRNQLKRKAARVTFTITFEPADGGEPSATRRVVRLPRRR